MSTDEPITPAENSTTPPSDTPWWTTPTTSESAPFHAYEPSSTASAVAALPARRNIGAGLVVLIAILAGAVGSVAGRAFNFATGSTHLVTTHSNIERAPNSISGIAARVLPSVVSISVESGAGGDTGSGFFIDSNGYILTNNHVVEAAITAGGTITVNLQSGKNFPAKIVGRDAAYDLAVLKIEVADAPALTLGNSDEVSVGDAVIAIGSPLGLAGTVTSGIISAKDRAVTAGSGSGESSFINALQTDAAINPGNSGGPLVNSAGAVIGVNSAIASLGSSFTGQSGSIGLGFAIPINQAKKTADQLIKTGSSTHPIIGLSLDNSFTGIGAKIASTPDSILPGGPAEKAGLRAGDVITAIDGRSVSSADELIVAVRTHNVGDGVTLTYKRGGITKEVTLKLIAKK